MWVTSSWLPSIYAPHSEEPRTLWSIASLQRVRGAHQILMADRKRLSKLLRKRVFAEHLAAAQIAAGPPTNAASAESDTPRPRGLSCGKRPRLTPPSPPPATRWRCCGTLFASIATASRHLSDSHGHCIDAGVTRAIAAIVADAQPTPSSATSSPINPSAGLSAKAIRLFGFVAASDGSGCGTCGCTVAVNVVPQAAASEPDIGAAAITAAAAARPARPVDRQNLTALDAAHRLVADDRAAHQPAGKGPAVADQDPSAAAGQCEPGHTHVVVLFYCYTAIARPAAMASWHRATCAELGLRGKIRVAAEGINGCVSGSEASTHRYIELVLQLPGLGDAMSPGDFKRSFAESAAFEGLQTSVVDEIITLGDATGAASSTETGQHLAPEEFHRMYGKFDLVLVHVSSRICKLHTTPHARRDVLYLVPAHQMLIGARNSMSCSITLSGLPRLAWTRTCCCSTAETSTKLASAPSRAPSDPTSASLHTFPSTAGRMPTCSGTKQSSCSARVGSDANGGRAT